MLEKKIDKSGPFVIAHLSGELTASESEGVIEELHEHVAGKGAKLAVDLSDVALIDSSGLSALVSLVNHARLGEGAVVLVAPSSFVSGIFSVTRLDTWFDICANMNEAGKALTQR
ncbi:MAG: STAS domain-containing protein [Phycisphaerales bacterium]|nr:MAG: STAS domain-containing protein [Phycisphaerales bacterium]